MTSIRLGILAAFLALWSAAAEAHAVILASSPGPNQEVSGKGLVVEILFNSRIDAARSALRVVTPDGVATTLPLSGAPSADTLKSRPVDLPPGVYRLHWQTLSPDGHISQGDIPFAASR